MRGKERNMQLLKLFPLVTGNTCTNTPSLICQCLCQSPSTHTQTLTATLHCYLLLYHQQSFHFLLTLYQVQNRTRSMTCDTIKHKVDYLLEKDLQCHLRTAPTYLLVLSVSLSIVSILSVVSSLL